MLRPKWVLLAGMVGALVLVSQLPSLADDEPTADQVIAQYLQAIGADRISSISTIVERGELSGNLTNYRMGYLFPGQWQGARGGIYEFYFKKPNLRFSSTMTGQNVLMVMHGCDGKQSWYIDRFLHHQEITPKPGKDSNARMGEGVSTSQTLLTLNNDGTVIGTEPAKGEITDTIGGNTTITPSDDTVGIGFEAGFLAGFGIEAGATTEGLSALGEAFQNVMDEIVPPTPPPPPTPPAPDESGGPDTHPGPDDSD